MNKEDKIAEMEENNENGEFKKNKKNKKQVGKKKAQEQEKMRIII